MGHQELKKSSSSSSSDEKKENEERVRTTSGSVNEEEIKYGEQLGDDLINSFCDKLQAVCPKKLEALLAIQFLMISDVAEVKKHVSGHREAVQVLYDKTRSHYVFVHFNPKNRRITLYDSLQTYQDEHKPRLIAEIGEQINHLFGHLFDKYIPIFIDREYELQGDNFSCGYRVIGALVAIARNRNPAEQHFSRTAILSLMREVLREPNVTWQMFEKPICKRRRSYTGEKISTLWMRNSMWNGSTSTSRSSNPSAASSRASSQASNKSSANSSTTSVNCSKRPSAGSSPSLVEVDARASPILTTPPLHSPVASEDVPPSDFMTHMYSGLARYFSLFRSMTRKKSDSLVDD